MDYSADHSASSSQSSVPDPIAGRADQMAWPGAAGHTSVPFPSAADSSGRIADQPWIRVPTRSSYTSPACLFSTRKGQSKVVTSSPRHASPLLAPFSAAATSPTPLQPTAVPRNAASPELARTEFVVQRPMGPQDAAVPRTLDPPHRHCPSCLPRAPFCWLGPPAPLQPLGYLHQRFCLHLCWALSAPTLAPPTRTQSVSLLIHLLCLQRPGRFPHREMPPPAQRWEHDRMVSLLVRYFYVPP